MRKPWPTCRPGSKRRSNSCFTSPTCSVAANAAKPTAQTEFVPAGESKKGISTFGLVLAALLLATLAYLTMTLVMGQQINFGQ